MKRIIIIFLLVLSVLRIYGENTLLYKVTGDKDVFNITYTVIETNAGYMIQSNQPGETRKSTANFVFAVHAFHYTNSKTSTDYTAQRFGNKIKISGRLKNRSIKREFIVNNNPWYQAIEHALEQFATSHKDKITFWFINADDCEIIEMEAIKQGTDSIKLQNRSQYALHVKVNLTGFAALFWSADYWFRKNDNRFIRYETTAGLGGPKLVIELMSENE